jgi:hypothetical protein
MQWDQCRHTRSLDPIQHDFEEHERELERVFRADPDYDSRLGPKSKMIHEVRADLEDLDGDLGVSSWFSFSHENSCSQCG